MDEPNFNKIIAIIGMRGTGKTPYIVGEAKHNIFGLIKTYLQYRNMKVLVIDTTDRFAYKDIPVVKIKDLEFWKQGVRRLWVRPDDISELNLYINTLPSMYNTFLVYEDAARHQDRQLDKSMKDLFVDSKEKNIDMLLVFHLFAQTPIDMFRWVDLIELFKTKDHPECRAEN